MSYDPLAKYSKYEAKNKSQSDPLEKYSKYEKKPDISPLIKYPAIAAGGMASGMTGAYGSLLNALGLAPQSTMLPGQEERYKREYEAPEKLLPFLQEEDIMPEYARLPTVEESAKYLEPEATTSGQRITKKVSEALGSGLPFGGGLKTAGELAVASGLGQSFRELGAPEGVATGIELLSLYGPQAIAKKVIVSKDVKNIADFLKKQGFSSSEITGMLRGKFQNVFSKLAKKDEKTENYIKDINEKFGNVYNNIKLKAGDTPVSKDLSDELVSSFQMIKKDLESTIETIPEQQKAIDFINKALSNIQKRGTTPKEAVNFFQGINDLVPWAREGKKYLVPLKDPLLKILHESNPKIAKDFETVNAAYSKFAKLRKGLKPTQLDEIKKAGPVGAIIFGMVTGIGPLAALGKFVKFDIVQRLSRQMLTNPRLARIPQKIIENVKQNKPKSVNAYIKLFGKEIKEEDPELSKDLGI